MAFTLRFRRLERFFDGGDKLAEDNLEASFGTCRKLFALSNFAALRTPNDGDFCAADVEAEN